MKTLEITSAYAHYDYRYYRDICRGASI